MPAASAYANSFSAEKGFDVTPSDTAVQPPHRGLWVGDGGHLVVEMRKGGTVTYRNIASGSSLGIRARIIFATGTTASNIVGML